MRRSCEEGQATTLVLGMALLVFAIAGLAVDGTRAFLYRRTLQTAADGASLAAASELDRAGFYRRGGHEIRLDPDSAERIARRWLGLRGLRVSAAVAADSERVRVVLRGKMPTMFLGLIGIGEVPVAAEALAEPRF